MSSDFFRRMVLNSPTIAKDYHTNGMLTLPTMTSILGADPNKMTNPYDAYLARDRMDTAERYGFIGFGGTGSRTTRGQASPGSFSMPSFMGGSVGNFFRGTGRFVTNIATAVGDMLVFPGTGKAMDKIFDSIGWTDLLTHRPVGGNDLGPYTVDASHTEEPSPFMPEWLGGSGQSSLSPDLRNRGPDGQRATGMGTYRGSGGFVTGTIDPRSMLGTFDPNVGIGSGNSDRVQNQVK